MNCANHPDRERSGFCQNCGKPLCAECIRNIGPSVFCEPCYVARAAGPAAPGAGSPPADTVWQWGAGMPPGWTPSAGPNPGLAALLGCVPGVGAMYNEQYAKGIVHLLVFVILVSLAHDFPILGVFVGGWIVYQVIEAHHTARARRDGTPLPNPFGLNDISERLGFGKAWPGGAPTSAPFNPASGAAWSAPNPAPNAAGTSAPGPPPTAQNAPGTDLPHTHPPYTNVPYSNVPPGSSYGSSYTYNYVPPASHWGASQDSYNYSVPPIPPVPPMPPYPDVPYPRRFPTGAIWLIGLGVFFLLANTGFFHLSARFFGPVVMIALGVWTFVRRMTFAGEGLANDGSPSYPIRLALALRGAAWLILIGVIWLLDALHILSWGMSWPIFLIAGGVMLFFRQSMWGGYGFAPYAGYPPTTPPPPAAAPVTTTDLVPTRDHSSGQEGR